MNNRRENRLSRNLKVMTFMDSHEATLLVGAPGLADFVTQYRGKTAECIEHAQEANEDITGSSEQKTYLRNAMRDSAVAVSGAMHAYFVSVKNLKEAKKGYLTKSEIDKARDTDAFVEAKRILETAQANSAEIIPFGATAAKVTALSDAIDAYYAMIQDPQDERIERTAALNLFDAAMKESDEILVIIAGIMLTQKEEYPGLHIQFIGATAIDDNIGGGTPTEPDYVFTINPTEFFNALTIAYNGARKFNVVNLSAQPLNWGLSNDPNSFTNLQFTLDGNASSTLMSTTLGVSGDYLVFENLSPEMINIEVTVLDE